MLNKVAAYRGGELDLGTLVQNLQGLMGAADFMDHALIEEFWRHEAPIDMELELRTESWAPVGAASDDALDDALDRFVTWVNEVTSASGTERA